MNNLNHTAILDFYPLYHMTDDGMYQCSIDVMANDSFVTDISNSASVTIDVLGMLSL